MIEKLAVELILIIANKLNDKEFIFFSLLSRKIRMLLIDNKFKSKCIILNNNKYFDFFSSLKISLPKYLFSIELDKNKFFYNFYLEEFNNINTLKLKNFIGKLIIENLSLEILNLDRCERIIIKKNNIKIYDLYNSTIINFDYNEYIEELIIDDCDFESDNEKLIFNNIKHIKKLSLINCHPDNLNLFKIFEKQRYLNLKFSTINFIDNFKNIETLNLQYTDIEEVNCLKNVKKLNLSYTAVKDVNSLGKVNILNLSNTFINDEGIKGLGQNICLDLTNTKIKNVNHLKNVKILNLSKTLIENEDIKELKNVKILTLNNTNISKIDFLINVKSLFIANTKVHIIPENLNLEELDISGCLITKKIVLKNIKQLHKINTKLLSMNINGCYIRN